MKEIIPSKIKKNFEEADVLDHKIFFLIYFQIYGKKFQSVVFIVTKSPPIRDEKAVPYGYKQNISSLLEI